MVEYLWHSEVFAEHNWAIELLQDLGMPLSFLGLHNTNPHLGEWQREVRALAFILCSTLQARISCMACCVMDRCSSHGLEGGGGMQTLHLVS